MTTYTKYTTSNWVEWVYSEEYQTIRDQKIIEMINAEKTDGEREFGTGFLIRRKWVDQAAAQEWANWITTHVPPDHLISIEISDIPPE
jgi:hypothetical protein